jgi:stalled ribosome rescue protein Dom34
MLMQLPYKESRLAQSVGRKGNSCVAIIAFDAAAAAVFVVELHGVIFLNLNRVDVGRLT